MIDFAKNEEPEKPNLPGVLGDGAARAGRHNMRLVRRAIREDWPIPADTRKALVEQMHDVLVDSESARSKIGAAMVLVAADGANIKRETLDQRDEHAYLPKTVMHLRPSDVRQFNEHDLDRIIAGDFTPIEDGGGSGEETPDSGEAEPT